MFDRLAWRREFYERYLLGLDDEEEHRRGPDVQVWTTPSGRRYACDPTGELMPLPDGEAPFRSWTS